MKTLKRSERLTMTVTMQLTESQALAMQAMFKYWNQLASMGSSRMVGYFVDGDGNFKPNCQVLLSHKITELTPEIAKAAIVEDDSGNRNYDFDPVAWMLSDKEITSNVNTKPKPVKAPEVAQKQETDCYVIEPDEEIQCYIGMDFKNALIDLRSKGVKVSWISEDEHIINRTTFAATFAADSVVLVVNKFGKITRTYYA